MKILKDVLFTGQHLSRILVPGNKNYGEKEAKQNNPFNVNSEFIPKRYPRTTIARETKSDSHLYALRICPNITLRSKNLSKHYPKKLGPHYCS